MSNSSDGWDPGDQSRAVLNSDVLPVLEEALRKVAASEEQDPAARRLALVWLSREFEDAAHALTAALIAEAEENGPNLKELASLVGQSGTSNLRNIYPGIRKAQDSIISAGVIGKHVTVPIAGRKHQWLFTFKSNGLA